MVDVVAQCLQVSKSYFLNIVEPVEFPLFVLRLLFPRELPRQFQILRLTLKRNIM